MTEIIVGCPGSGKTSSLIDLVSEELSRGVPPDRIGYLSFTKRAAIEATTRAKEQFELSQKDLPYFSTIHSLCFRQLGLRRGDVLEGKRLIEFGQHAGIKVTGRWSEDGTLTGYENGDRILHMNNLARVRGIPLRELFDDDCDGLRWYEVERVVKALDDFKADEGLIDFTDMLIQFLQSGLRLNLDVLLIDEAQDLSKLQWQVVACLSQGCRRVVVSADTDQAIYKWGGADVDHVLDMPGNVRVLGQSHRVPPAIQGVAAKIIERVRNRRDKPWAPRAGGDGVVDRERWFNQVELGASSVLVLARNSYVLRDHVEPWLRRTGIIYERHGHSSLSPSLMTAVRTWEALRKGETVTTSEARKVYEQMSSGAGFMRGHKTLPGFEDDAPLDFSTLQKDGGLLLERTVPWFEALDKLPVGDREYLRAALARGEKVSAKPRVVVSTIHGAKGAESDHVVLMKEIAPRTQRETQKNPEDERRVWYVGLTRAKERLTIVESSKLACPWL